MGGSSRCERSKNISIQSLIVLNESQDEDLVLATLWEEEEDVGRSLSLELFLKLFSQNLLICMYFFFSTKIQGLLFSKCFVALIIN